MATFCLTVHAAYRCRHTGACCSAPWRIPVERATLPLLRAHSTLAEILDRTHDESDLPRRDDGTCVFLESSRDRLCAIHRAGGPELLPSACRHFPRVALNDPRGTFVTLSSFCPTVAEMLQTAGPLRVIEAPRSIALDGPLDGLDATAVLPPLLRTGVLMDYEGYSTWEHEAIAVFDRDDLDVTDAIGVIAEATRRAREWRPGAGSLASHVQASFASVCPARSAVVDGSRPARMFAAAHLFGSWAAYQDGGINGVVDAVRDASRRLQRHIEAGATFAEAARASDLALRHTLNEGDEHGRA